MPEPKEPSDKLKFIFDNVNNWLKFAEGKNAALLVANSAFAFQIFRLLVDDKNINNFVYCYLIFCIILAAVSACLCLFSFIPKTSIPFLSTGKCVQENANLIFYGDIAKFTPKRYWEALRTQNIISEEYAQDKFLTDIANQIVINSKIALTKYSFFKIAIWLTVTAVISPILTLIIALILYANRSV